MSDLIDPRKAQALQQIKDALVMQRQGSYQNFEQQMPRMIPSFHQGGNELTPYDHIQQSLLEETDPFGALSYIDFLGMGPTWSSISRNKERRGGLYSEKNRMLGR